MEGDNTPAIESKIIPRLGVRFVPLIAGRLKKEISIWTIISFFKIPIGFIQALYIVLKEKPDVVVSFGGYVGLPVVFAAWLFSIPILLHEQTLVSGLANKLSGLFADKIAVSFQNDYSFDKDKIIFTGNPLRVELLQTDNKNLHMHKNVSNDIKDLIKLSKKKKLPLLLITGGNQGSHIINKAIEQVLVGLLKNYCIVHQVGDSKFKDFERLVPRQAENYLIRKWIDVNDWSYLLKNTDIAVSRSGVNTLIELAYFGIPTVTIPLPGIYANEQEKNAEYFKVLGLCQIIYQKDLSAKKLKLEIERLRKDLKNYRQAAENSRKDIIEDSARRLALEVKILNEKDV